MTCHVTLHVYMCRTVNLPFQFFCRSPKNLRLFCQNFESRFIIKIHLIISIIFFKGPLLEHKDKNQVLLDVNRCGRRLPKGEDERRAFNYRVRDYWFF